MNASFGAMAEMNKGMGLQMTPNGLLDTFQSGKKDITTA